MKWKPALILFILIFSMLPLKIVFADNESLYVDGFNSVSEDWTETGASPWLDDNIANYIYVASDEATHSEFTFADSSGSGTINSVTFYVETDEDASGNNEYVQIYIWDGTSWTLAGEIDPDDDWSWKTLDLSTLLDTWPKIDDAKLYVVYQNQDGPGLDRIDIRRAYLYIDYSVAGQNYVADVSQSLASSQSILTETDYVFIPTQNLITSWIILTQWDTSINLAQSVVSSWTALLKADMIVDITQNLLTSWNVLTQWNALTDLTQGINAIWQTLTEWDTSTNLVQSLTTSWNVVTQSTFNILPTLSSSFTWIVDAVIGEYIPINYIADLTQSLTTSYNVLLHTDFITVFTQAIVSTGETITKWNALATLTQALDSTWQIVIEWDSQVALTQSLATSWSVLTQTNFNALTTLSNTFTWMVDVLKSTYEGVAYIVNLSQSVANSWNVLTQTSFNVVSSLSNTFTWTIDAIKGMQRSASLTVSITTSWIVEIVKGIQVKTIRVLVTALTSGLSVKDAMVTLSNPSAGTILWAYYTDPLGYTPEEDLESGEYYLTVFKDDYQPYSYLFNFSDSIILEAPLRTIEEGIMIDIPMLVIFLFAIAFTGIFYLYEGDAGIGIISCAGWIALALYWTYNQTTPYQLAWIWWLMFAVNLILTAKTILQDVVEIGLEF